jgi:hypothetical protein
MSFLLQPWHILVAALCGIVNQRQQQVIEFQNAQIETLLKKLGKKRLLLNDDQRRLLAVKAHDIGRKTLLELTTIVTPDTIFRWHMERWFRSLKSECLHRMVFFGQRSLERAVTNFVQHYHRERNHQGLGNHLIDPEKGVGAVAGKIECRERLGGMLKYYHRRAA